MHAESSVCVPLPHVKYKYTLIQQALRNELEAAPDGFAFALGPSTVIILLLLV